MRFKRVQLRWWLLMTGFIVALRVNALAADADGPERSVADIRRETAQLFGKLQVLPLKIHLDARQLGKLPTTYTNLAAYVPAEIRQGDQTYSKVGLRLRGVSTFQTVEEKPNFTLKFNEFVAGQRFFGVRKVRLSNAAMDATYLQEWLAWHLFTAAGVATPRVNFVRVELNGRDLGLYILIEGITKDFLKLNWGTDKGSVYEADDVDIDGGLEQDYGKRNRHQTDLGTLVAAINETDPKRRLERLHQAIDVKQFASYVAVEVLMNVWDGYSMRINNYRVFSNHDNGKVYFVPHGLDRLFEDPADPIVPEWKGRVTQTLMAIPETRQLYVDRLAELTSKLMVKEDLVKRLDEAREVIRPTLTELNAERAQSRALLLLKKSIDRRIEVLNQELPQLRKPVKTASGQ